MTTVLIVLGVLFGALIGGCLALYGVWWLCTRVLFKDAYQYLKDKD